mmetsp:Transcript_7063/g.21594  ORF Transcript_7063/g.21594 Transcript_7063/m.21594 type:complete len:205 (-) Transcript_7063:1281-1895(-)
MAMRGSVGGAAGGFAAAAPPSAGGPDAAAGPSGSGSSGGGTSSVQLAGVGWQGSLTLRSGRCGSTMWAMFVLTSADSMLPAAAAAAPTPAAMPPTPLPTPLMPAPRSSRCSRYTCTLPCELQTASSGGSTPAGENASACTCACRVPRRSWKRRAAVGMRCTRMTVPLVLALASSEPSWLQASASNGPLCAAASHRTLPPSNNRS